MKIISFFLLFFLTGCSFIFQLNHLGSAIPIDREQWRKNNSMPSYNLCISETENMFSKEEMELMNNFDISSRYNLEKNKLLEMYDMHYSDCLYNKGYRFIPEIGYCSYWKDTYICKNRSKYSPNILSGLL